MVGNGNTYEEPVLEADLEDVGGSKEGLSTRGGLNWKNQSSSRLFGGVKGHYHKSAQLLPLSLGLTTQEDVQENPCASPFLAIISSFLSACRFVCPKDSSQRWGLAVVVAEQRLSGDRTTAIDRRAVEWRLKSGAWWPNNGGRRPMDGDGDDDRRTERDGQRG